MSSTALYKAFIEVGASEVSATRAAEDVIQVSQLPQLATKADITNLESRIEVLRSETAVHIANLETRLLKWMVSCGFLFTGVVIAGVSLVV